MKAWALGVCSALTASACCLGPLVLALLGLGSFGLGTAVGRYHRWFVVVALALLATAWWRFVRELMRCRTSGCRMAHGKITGVVLLLAALAVFFFAGGW